MAADFLGAGLGRAKDVATSDRAKEVGGAALTAAGAVVGDQIEGAQPCDARCSRCRARRCRVR
jgi:hypothetical protein